MRAAKKTASTIEGITRFETPPVPPVGNQRSWTENT